MKEFVVTKRLRQLAIETIYSLDDLSELKYSGDLTDNGVELVAKNAVRNGLSLFDTFTRMQIMIEYDLGAKLFGEYAFAGVRGSSAGDTIRKIIANMGS